MSKLNNKGQSLVLFIVVIPVLLGVMALVVDLGNAFCKKAEINSVLEYVLDYGTLNGEVFFENEGMEYFNEELVIWKDKLKNLLDYNLDYSENKIILNDNFYNLFKTNDVVFLNIKTKLKEVKTVTITTAGAQVIIEGIANQDTFSVGEVVKFKVYLADKKDLGKKVSVVKYNDTKARLDSDGFFTITITNEAESKLQIRITSAGFASGDYNDYDLVLHSSVDVGEPETPTEPTPEPETPSDSGSGSSCQLGIGSTSILFAVIACLGAVIIATKRFVKSK